MDPSALFEPESPLATGGAPPGLRASVARRRRERARGGGARGGSGDAEECSSPGGGGGSSPFPSPPVSPSAFQGPVYSLSDLLEGNLQRGTRATRKARRRKERDEGAAAAAARGKGGGAGGGGGGEASAGGGGGEGVQRSQRGSAAPSQAAASAEPPQLQPPPRRKVPAPAASVDVEEFKAGLPSRPRGGRGCTEGEDKGAAAAAAAETSKPLQRPPPPPAAPRFTYLDGVPLAATPESETDEHELKFKSRKSSSSSPSSSSRSLAVPAFEGPLPHRRSEKGETSAAAAATAPPPPPPPQQQQQQQQHQRRREPPAPVAPVAMRTVWVEPRERDCGAAAPPLASAATSASAPASRFSSPSGLLDRSASSPTPGGWGVLEQFSSDGLGSEGGSVSCGGAAAEE